MTTARTVIACAAACSLAAAPYAFRLDAAACVSADQSVVAALGPSWQDVSHFAQTCPVRAPDGSAPVSVAIVRLDQMMAKDVFRAQPDLHVPSPLIRDADGRTLGDLMEGFPEDPPGRLRVTFSDWRHGWPWRIDLYEAGESALPPHALEPLLWNGETRSYVVMTRRK